MQPNVSIEDTIMIGNEPLLSWKWLSNKFFLEFRDEKSSHSHPKSLINRVIPAGLLENDSEVSPVDADL